jgi:hypothetical protein
LAAKDFKVAPEVASSGLEACVSSSVGWPAGQACEVEATRSSLTKEPALTCWLVEFREARVETVRCRGLIEAAITITAASKVENGWL